MSEHGPGAPLDDETRARLRAARGRVDRVNAWLHVGGALSPDAYQKLVSSGVTHVVDLRQDHEDIGDVSKLEDLGIQRLQVPVPNQHAPQLEQLSEVSSWFEDSQESASLYVHCGGGFGRAAVMSVALLVQKGATVDAAIEQVKAARPEIRPNEEQMTWLREVEARRGETGPGVR